MNCNPFDIMQRTQSNSLSGLITIIPIVLIFIIVAASMQLEESYDNPLNNNPLNNNPSNKIVIVKSEEPNQNFKTVKSPSNGTVQLIKGVGKVIHHSIKEDSVIMLSRKNIEGKVGSHLIIGKIEPNQYFTVHSVSEFETSSDKDSDIITGVETEDFGEIYFLII